MVILILHHHLRDSDLSSGILNGHDSCLSPDQNQWPGSPRLGPAPGLPSVRPQLWEQGPQVCSGPMKSNRLWEQSGAQTWSRSIYTSLQGPGKMLNSIQGHGCTQSVGLLTEAKIFQTRTRLRSSWGTKVWVYWKDMGLCQWSHRLDMHWVRGRMELDMEGFVARRPPLEPRVCASPASILCLHLLPSMYYSPSEALSGLACSCHLHVPACVREPVPVLHPGAYLHASPPLAASMFSHKADNSQPDTQPPLWAKGL